MDQQRMSTAGYHAVGPHNQLLVRRSRGSCLRATAAVAAVALVAIGSVLLSLDDTAIEAPEASASGETARVQAPAVPLQSGDDSTLPALKGVHHHHHSHKQKVGLNHKVQLIVVLLLGFGAGIWFYSWRDIHDERIGYVSLESATVVTGQIVGDPVVAHEVSPRTCKEYVQVLYQGTAPDSILLHTVLACCPKGKVQVQSVGQGVEALPGLSGEEVRKTLSRLGFDNLPQLIPVNENAGKFAISHVGSRRPLSHQALLDFVKHQRLQKFGISRGNRCAVLLPNGPEKATCLFVCMSQCVCVPINVNQTPLEIRAELVATRCDALIVHRDERRLSDLLEGLEVTVLKLTPDGNNDGSFSLSILGSQGIALPMSCDNDEELWNKPKDLALVLLTSGTSGKKKIVAYSLETLIVGSVCLIHSWSLSKADICMNMMPLHHVGGITRSVLASILAGGGTICAPAFDASQFWECLCDPEVSPTWYYAGPTMHQVILQEGNPCRSRSYGRMRFVANASGGLLETLATRMRETFGCPVLPCYGMTECLPISSPPLKMKLEYPSASGQIVGPRVRIMDLAGRPMACGLVGNIAVKGMPTMVGYDDDEAANKESFYDDGWFNTGDTGFLNQDGWLTITGRSKEVINRGGEIISPFEVEEAVAKHERVNDALAFSVPHAVLQEVVGVVVVPQPGKPRMSLTSLQKFVSETLQPSKWPQVLVFMDSLPRGQGNKTQRIRLAERFGILPLENGQSPLNRTFQGKTPSSPTDLNVKIPIKPVTIDLQEIERAVDSLQSAHGVTESLVVSSGEWGDHQFAALYVAPETTNTEKLLRDLQGVLHDYAVPHEVITVAQIPKDRSQLPRPRCLNVEANHVPARTHTEHVVQSLWTEALGKAVSVEADFFAHGGTSLLAGRVAARIRSSFGIPLTAASLFHFPTIAAVAEEVDSLLTELQSEPSRRYAAGLHTEGTQTRVEPESQTSLVALAVQILPLCLLQPLRLVVSYLCFISVWLYIATNFQIHRFYAIVLGALITGVIMDTVPPLLGILCKWTVIGRYREGKYPIWGSYYLRWWFVHQFLEITGAGVFRTFSWSLRWYYRAMGASIGKNVDMNKLVVLSEFDLITIGDNTIIDNQTLRAFCLDYGAMKLTSVVIGSDVVIPHRVFIAPGSQVPAGTCFGMLSSSYEAQDGTNPANRTLCKQLFPQPRWQLKLFGHIVLFWIWLAEQAPVLVVLHAMVVTRGAWYIDDIHNYAALLHWLLTPQRIGFFLLLRVVRSTVCPCCRFLAYVVVKWTVVGKFRPGRRDRSEYILFCHWLMAEAMNSDQLQDVAELVGNHYEGRSWMYRLLGAKIGKRIYWPGSGFQSLVEFDLLEVGDDVVFGSRSVILTCDAETAAPVRIKDGAFVGDRCVLLPGCTLERNAVLGSGGLGPKNFTFPAGSTWIGSKAGSPVQLSAGTDALATASTIKPFGRAMYLGQASYSVLPWCFHSFLAIFCRCFEACFRTFPILFAVAVTASMIGEGVNVLSRGSVVGTDPKALADNVIDVAVFMVPGYVVAYNFATLSALISSWSAKWLIMGRREVGNFDWDRSDYCQRWQIYLAVTLLTRCVNLRPILDYLTGSAYLVWWFRAHGSYIGRNVCLYPTGADPMMTEPELVQIGDGACIDNAALMSHINSAGTFTLNRLVVGPGATLRSSSRLLSGAAMMPNSTLLEHTCVLSGDVVDEGSIWQGWPGRLIWRENVTNPVTVSVISNHPLKTGKAS